MLEAAPADDMMTMSTYSPNLNFSWPFLEHDANKLEIIGTETSIMRQLMESIDNCLITYFNIKLFEGLPRRLLRLGF